MPFDVDGQLVHVAYLDSAAMSPADQDALVNAIRAQAVNGPVGLLFAVGAGARVVDPAVSAFWLEQVRNKELKIRAMAIVTTRLGVRVAAQAFAQANRVLGTGLDVAVEQDEAAARAWLLERLAGR
ncbi:MAG: hypothetical protein JST54_02530 [Deltaproteobacteria bacterium]|nr:hypothetical protein [Deltaproteobacteria bacterium]